MSVELLGPLPPTPLRVSEEWAETPNHSWLQLGRCYYTSGEPTATDEPKAWEMVRRSTDLSVGRASASAKSEAVVSGVEPLLTLIYPK